MKHSLSLARAAMTLFLVMLCSVGTWATSGTPAGSGTSSDPYVIADADDWSKFVTWINNSSSNSTYSSKCYKLGADITISSMAGTSNYKFKGTFDGCGHTITLNDLSSTGEFCAPFRYVDGATFKRIHTTGTVVAGTHTTNDKYRSGLVGESRGNTTITNCWSSVTITTQIDGDGTHGGFVGVVSSGTLTITNCRFDGTITGDKTYANAGMVGWTGDCTTNINNCLMAGTINTNTQNGATFMRGSEKGGVVNTKENIKVNNSYYVTAHGTVQGTAVGDMTNAQLQAALGDGWEISGSTLVPVMSDKNLALATISGLASPYYIWTGSAILVNYTVTDAGGNTLTKGTDYTATISPSPVQEVGEYTLTITGTGSYSGTKVVTFEVRRILQGSGTADDPYLISSDIDWNTFVNWINNENSTYRNKYYKLTADINVTSTVGTSDDNSFRGTFDGDGHTMTLDLTSDGDYFAPFRYCYNTTVTFKRLHIAGTINSNHKYVGSLVGYQHYGTLNIINCWSSVTINSSKADDYTGIGGFVGYTYANVNITNCRFDGKLLGASSKGCGGFVGYRSNYAMNITNCLYAPTEVTVSSTNSNTFVRYFSGKMTNCYYTETLGGEQGTAVGSMTNAELLQALGYGWEINSNKVVPILDIKNLTAGSVICNTFYPYTGSEITVTPTVKDMDGNVIDAANYSVVCSPSPVQTSGNYTMTVTGDANGYSGTLTHAFRVASSLNGAGTETVPYTIASTADWNTFAEMVNGGNDFSGEFVKLIADIDNVTTMVGLRENGGDVLLDAPFKGTFDGDNHTLTVAIVSTATGDGVNERGVAPFHYIKHATIKNLTVAGSITSSSLYTGGLVGWAASNAYSEQNYINDCVITATITISADYAGGFVGHIVPYGNGYENYTNFTNCVFAGTIQSSTTEQRKAGAFFGYGYAYAYFTDCLENGTYANLSSMNPRGAYNSYYNSSIKSLYYVNKIGSVGSYITDGYGCHQVVTTVPANDIYLTRTIKGYTVYQPAILNDLKDVYAYNNGDPVSISYALKMGSTTMTKDTDYEVVVSPAAIAAIDTYNITFTAKDGNSAGYTGSATRSFRVMEGESLDGYVFATEGEGDNKVYLINDESDLERLAAYVNSGHEAVGLTFKLNADITMTAAHTAIGGYINYSNYRKFRGTFDGNNKTIKNLSINKPNEDYQGLFGYIGENAVVKNVTIDGYNITAKQNVGAIVGYANASSSNRATIQNCHANGTNVGSVADANFHGGIVGYAYYVDITGCTSQGTISTTAGNAYYGGIVGCASYSVNVTSCENAASIIGQGDRHGGIVGDDDYSSNRYSLCLNTGTVEGSNYKGGIAGDYYYSSNYTNCYYATPCTVKALNDWDSNGNAERGYVITAGDHISSIVVAEDGFVTSAISGKKYYKKGDWTLTLTPDLTNASFITYACEGGTLTNLDTADGEHKLTIKDLDVTISAFVSDNSGVDMSTVEIAAIPDQRWKSTDPIIPALTITNGTTPLVLGTDYLVEGTGNTSVGVATLTLTGINNYKGSRTVTFNIVDFPLLDPTKDNASDNPYLIATEADLQVLASLVNSNARRDGFYRQTADITLTEEHTPIGNSSRSFQGTYDGNGKTISGLVINKPNDNYQGLFGNVYNSTIKNVIIDNCQITGKEYVGGVAGYVSWETIDNCVVTGTISGYGRVGGIGGYLYYNSIKNSFSDATVNGTIYVGSIVGHKQSGTLTNNCHTTSTTGGVGNADVTTGTDQTGAEVVVKITAGTDVTITYPATPTYTWNGEDLYKSGTEVTLEYALPAGKFFDHYSVNSGEISNAGTIDGKHTLTGFTEDVVISGSWVDSQTDLATTATIADIAALTFNGQVQQPLPVVTSGTETLVKDENYSVSYSDGCTNVGEYTVIVTGIGRYNGSLTKTYMINPLDISADGAITVNGIYANYPQTGSEQHPTPATVTSPAANNATLVAGTDYTLSYSDGCTTPGNYTVSLTGQGNYIGTKVLNFAIDDGYGLTVYDGANTNEYVPLYGYYCDYYQKNEFVMPAAELAALSGKAITSMQFYLSSKASSAWNGTFQVFVKEVDFNSFKSPNNKYSGTDDAAIVYEGSLDGTQDIMTINFNKAYAYNGGNLLIGIYKTTKDNCPKASFYGQTVSNASIGGSNSSSLSSVGVGLRNFLPKTTFLYESCVELADNSDNKSLIDSQDGNTINVILAGRTLYKDGGWNTLTLPFNVTLGSSVLKGAEARTLDNATVTGSKLNLTFSDPVTELEAGTPYIIKWNASDLVIKTEDDWNNFASAVAGGNTYENKVVQLGADITVSTQVGVWKGDNNTGNRLFKGTFDGAGHTLTLNLTGSGQGTAPFSAVQDATIMNLKTTGTVTLTVSNAFHASGLVGFSNGSTIKNCHVNASILFPDGTGTVHSGGIIGHALSAPFTMTDCLFDGTIGYVAGGTGTMINVGGLVGWDDSSTPTIKNCLNNGTFANPSVISRIARVQGHGTIDNCYSTVNATSGGDRGDDRGTITTATGSDLAALLGSGWKVDGGSVVPVFGKITKTITNPVFTNVTIDNTVNNKVFTDAVTFEGTYAEINFTADDLSILFMGANNKVYYPKSGAYLGAQRALFRLANGLTVKDIANGVRIFFGSDDTEVTVGIFDVETDRNVRDGHSNLFTIDGKKLDVQPTRKGIYIQNGRKVVIK